MQQKTDIKSMPFERLTAYVKSLGEPAYRAGQIFAWLSRGAASFSDMTDLSLPLRQRLDEAAFITHIEPVRRLVSAADGTVKYLYRLADGQQIESVLMEYHHGRTICVSTQAGCRMGCAFCASTIGGRARNLTAGEILDQILVTGRGENATINNIVLMGIGEPLDNFDNVADFLRIVGDKKGLNIGYRHISLSTCGLADEIMRLADLGMPVTLSVSLHAPNDPIRDRLMPVNRKWNVGELMRATRYYIEKTGRRVSFEYAMIRGVNDRPEHAAELCRLVAGMLCHINLIPVNPVAERGFLPSERRDVERFRQIIEGKGFSVTVRRTLGGDISASCGQLRNKVNGESGLQ